MTRRAPGARERSAPHSDGSRVRVLGRVDTQPRSRASFTRRGIADSRGPKTPVRPSSAGC
jgi:hypothetical protein